MDIREILESYYYGADNPFLQGRQQIEQLLNAVETSAAWLRPEAASVRKTTRAYSRENVQQLLKRQDSSQMVTLVLERQASPQVTYRFSFLGKEKVGLALWMRVPFDFFLDPQESVARSQQFVALVRALADCSRPLYGLAHNQADAALGSDPTRTNSFAPKRVYEMYWLNLYGREMVKSIGRERILSTPAYALEELPGDAFLILTRPTPADYASNQAREAQARALAHLRKSTKFETALASLQERSEKLDVGERDWDPDLKPVLESIYEYVNLDQRHAFVKQFNGYRAPEVTEWLPLDQAPPSDVPDPAGAIHQYAGAYAEQLMVILQDKVADILAEQAETLPQIDSYFYRAGFPEKFKRADIDADLIPAIGGYLGQVMVKQLGGRWVPRQNLDEAQVVVGDRAWLPFLRARHYMQSRQAILDYSLTKFYRSVQEYLIESGKG